MAVITVGPGGDHLTIQAAINDAVVRPTPPHEISIATGSYLEELSVTGFAGGLTLYAASGVAADVLVRGGQVNPAFTATSCNTIALRDLTIFQWHWSYSAGGIDFVDTNNTTLTRVVVDSQLMDPATPLIRYYTLIGQSSNHVLTDVTATLPGNSPSILLLREGGGTGFALTDCRLTSGGMTLSILNAPADSVTLTRCLLRSIGGSPFQFRNSQNLDIINCVLLGNESVTFRSAARNFRIRNSIIDTYYSAIYADGSTANEWTVAPWDYVERYNTLRSGVSNLIGWGSTFYTLATWQQAGAPGWNGGQPLSDSGDPYLHDPSAWPSDVHLDSQYGRWDPATSSWTVDLRHSPAIDAGNPADSVGSELAGHNGSRINRGVYGGTAQASLSLASPGYVGQPLSDVTGDPCTELVTWGSRRWGTFTFGAGETFAFCEKILGRLPPYIVRNQLLRQIVGGIAKQFEIHWRDTAAMPFDRITQDGVHDYAEDWGLLLSGDEKIPEVLSLLAKRDTIIGARGTLGINVEQSGPVAEQLDWDSGLLNEVDRLCKSKYLNKNGFLAGETRAKLLSADQVGWYLTERKTTAELGYPNVNVYGVFTKDNSTVLLGVSNGFLFLRCRNRNVERWSNADLEATIRRRLIPADIEVSITIVEI